MIRTTSSERVVEAAAPGGVAPVIDPAALLDETLLDEACAVAACVAGTGSETTESRAQRERERIARAIQRASEEQARRVVQSLLDFQNALPDCLAQPCIVTNGEGEVLKWNDAMAQWTGVSAKAALGRSLLSLFLPELHQPLCQAIQEAQGQIERGSAVAVTGTLPACVGMTGAQFTLIPQCRIPGCLETLFLLFRLRDPASPPARA